MIWWSLTAISPFDLTGSLYSSHFKQWLGTSLLWSHRLAESCHRGRREAALAGTKHWEREELWDTWVPHTALHLRPPRGECSCCGLTKMFFLSHWKYLCMYNVHISQDRGLMYPLLNNGIFSVEELAFFKTGKRRFWPSYLKKEIFFNWISRSCNLISISHESNSLTLVRIYSHLNWIILWLNVLLPLITVGEKVSVIFIVQLLCITLRHLHDLEH